MEGVLTHITKPSAAQDVSRLSVLSYLHIPLMMFDMFLISYVDGRFIHAAVNGYMFSSEWSTDCLSSCLAPSRFRTVCYDSPCNLHETLHL